MRAGLGERWRADCGGHERPYFAQREQKGNTRSPRFGALATYNRQTREA